MGTLDIITGSNTESRPARTSAPAPMAPIDKVAKVKEMITSFSKVAATKIAEENQALRSENATVKSDYANYQRAVKIAHALLVNHQIEPSAFLTKVGELLKKNLDVVEEAMKLGSFNDPGIGSLDHSAPVLSQTSSDGASNALYEFLVNGR